MRKWSLLFLVFGLPLFAFEDKPKAMTPEEAAKKIGEKCIVEMVVKSVGKGNGTYYLNAKEDFRDKENFSIYIKKEVAEKFAEAKIEDPVKHYKDKKIRVKGEIVLYKEKPEIILEKLDQIEFVDEEKKVEEAKKSDKKDK
jgi:hypothetical protein